MPSQSGDPVTSALRASLSESRSDKNDKDISQLLYYSAKQILLSDIEYEEFTYDSTAFLSGLKSKYTVLSERDAEANDESQSKRVPAVHPAPESNPAVKKDGKANSGDRTEVNRCKSALASPARTLWPRDAVSLSWKPNTPVGGGFINLWNSCYINSTLQALFHIPSFVNWLLMDNSHKCPHKNNVADCLICSLAQTLKSSQENTGKAIKPYLIYSRLKSICKHLNPGYQEDAHEFLRHLVDSLDRTYLLPFKDLRLDHLSKETTPLSQIFGGYLRNEVVCQSCGHISTTFQYFQDLPLDIASSSHIDGALDSFFSRESVSEHEYRCESCKKRVPFTKKFSLEKSPRVLCIQLKRFGAVSGKNNKSITIAGKLNLDRFRAVKNGDSFEPYHLASVINHIGTSTSCGHYTAIAQASDNRFYLFDDQRVERMHDLTQNSSQAYILLYHQKPSTMNSLKPASKLVTSASVKIATQSGSQESAKERIFGKGDPGSTKNCIKLFSSSVFTKVSTTVTNSLNSVLSKVNGSSSSSSSASSSSAGGSSEQQSVSGKCESTTEKESVEVGGGSNKSLAASPARISVKAQSTLKESPEEKKVESTSSFNSTPIVNGHKNINKSLVPYNESSCSSSDEDSSKEVELRCKKSNDVAARSKTLDPDTSPSPSKKPRFETEKPPDKMVNGTQPSTPVKNGPCPSPQINGHSSPAKPPRYTNGNSNGIEQNGSQHGSNWTVTVDSPDKSDPPRNNWKNKGLEERQPNFESLNHRGYGKPVSSWTGDKSEMEKEICRENFINKRLSNYDSYDTPNKKIKTYRGSNGNFYEGKNRFNEAQKRKNWHNKSKREYRFYSRGRHRSEDFHYKYYNKQWNLL